jgi:hypothetical protein
MFYNLYITLYRNLESIYQFDKKKMEKAKSDAKSLVGNVRSRAEDVLSGFVKLKHIF